MEYVSHLVVLAESKVLYSGPRQEFFDTLAALDGEVMDRVRAKCGQYAVPDMIAYLSDSPVDAHRLLEASDRQKRESKASVRPSHPLFFASLCLDLFCRPMWSTPDPSRAHRAGVNCGSCAAAT